MVGFLAENSLYIVLTISLVCWIGIFIYLMRLDKKISTLEGKLEKEKK